MKIAWSPEAIEDLVSLRAYIAEDNPAAARRTVQHIVESIEQLLPDNPRIGRAGRVPGTRELVIPRSPLGFSEQQSRSYASIMRRDAGLTVFDQPLSPGGRKPKGTWVGLGLRVTDRFIPATFRVSPPEIAPPHRRRCPR